MPARLRPTAPIAADAVLVGDPGRALMLAQALLEQPKMSNHARGLWGYSGRTPDGPRADRAGDRDGRPERGPGARRPGRAGGAAGDPGRHLHGARPGPRPGELLAVAEAHAWGGGGAGERGRCPTRELAAAAGARSWERRRGRRRSPASTPSTAAATPAPDAAGDAADMQTAALFAGGRRLGVDARGGPDRHRERERRAARTTEAGRSGRDTGRESPPQAALSA